MKRRLGSFTSPVMAYILAFNDRAWPTVTALLVLAMSALTLMPLPEVDMPEPLLNDKVQHLLAYAAIAFPAALARPRYWVWLMAMFFAWGLAIEALQPLVGRQRSAADALANGTGLALGVLAAATLRALAAPERAESHR